MKSTRLLTAATAAVLAPATLALALPLPHVPSVSLSVPVILAITTTGVAPSVAVQRALAPAKAPLQRFYPNMWPDDEASEGVVPPPSTMAAAMALQDASRSPQVKEVGREDVPRAPCRKAWRRWHSDSLAVWLVLSFFGIVLMVEVAGAVWTRYFAARHGAIRLPVEEKTRMASTLTVKAETDVESGKATGI